ncbi:MAG: NUDIX domain-containing protein [Candidatus Marinimicrobia bacterium]|nr:NUDIX domain-containing protein [Candidatus Neomarinimicrobiota bacterium]
MTEVVVRVIDLHVVRWVKQEPRYLLLHRAKGQMYAGVWQGVTGKLEKGEKAWETALRELREETGQSARRLWTVDQVNFFYEASHDRMNAIPVFGAEVADEEVVLSKEHDYYQWSAIEEAVKLILWGQQRTGLRAFHDMLTQTKEKLRWTEVPLKSKAKS